jgi:hypothetical protein
LLRTRCGAGEFDDQAFGPADVAEEERVLEVHDLPDRFPAFKVDDVRGVVDRVREAASAAAGCPRSMGIRSVRSPMNSTLSRCSQVVRVAGPRDVGGNLRTCVHAVLGSVPKRAHRAENARKEVTREQPGPLGTGGDSATARAFVSRRRQSRAARSGIGVLRAVAHAEAPRIVGCTTRARRTRHRGSSPRRPARSARNSGRASCGPRQRCGKEAWITIAVH